MSLTNKQTSVFNTTGFGKFQRLQICKLTACAFLIKNVDKKAMALSANLTND